MSINKSWDEKPYDKSAYYAHPGDNSWDDVLNISGGGPGEAQVFFRNKLAEVAKLRITIDGAGPLPSTEFSADSARGNLYNCGTYSFLSTFKVEGNAAGGASSFYWVIYRQ